jgi:integrase
MASISQRGTTWRAMVRRRGQTLTRTCDTREEAETWAAAEEARILRGETAEQVRRTPTSVTVAALMDRYAKEVSPTKGGWRWEAIRLARLATEFPMPVVELDGPSVAEWRDRRRLTVSAATVKREMTLLSAVLTKALKEWRVPIAANPVHTIEWPRQTPARRRRVSATERAAILLALDWDGVAAPRTRQQWVAWGFCLALESMMRQGEILRLTWEHVHLPKRTAHLPKTKNGESRDVPLSSRAVALFQLLPEGKPGQRVVPMNGGTFGNYFRLATKAAGIADLHFHDSRREALTQASKKLSNVAELARASGHRSLKSLMIYYEPDPSDLAEKLG